MESHNKEYMLPENKDSNEVTQKVIHSRSVLCHKEKHPCYLYVITPHRYAEYRARRVQSTHL